MIQEKSIIAMIPARGGSKGIPRKNIRLIAGKPLIAWTIEAAQRSRYIDRLIISSDDAEIIRVANEWGCESPFVRPAELSGDTVNGVEPMLHALEALHEKYEYIVLLQPTSPLRTTEDIDRCIELCIERKAPVCFTITEVDKTPFKMFTMKKDSTLQTFVQSEAIPSSRLRQDMPAVYAENGAVYVARVEWLLEKRTLISNETIGLTMPPERSVDIDSELDLLFSELLLRRTHEPGFIS